MTHYSYIVCVFLYPALTGSKTPTSRLKKIEKISGRSTAGMRPMK
ncbi:spermidine/putrescine ABC transporter ATP-binding protein [Psychrobacillus lasiicapitis]|uniref:Spermidine/putrescine ABC transporter ATP-binding protein n=1 Tax=Psychrobacillus lasiicapitis TaxID=1636719 RepID=A0A544SVB5_9BACI|nr:spermidine/putrescine ABC transporter ATP-binding protein [Psychrobacillus lasiicapitis]